MSNVTPGNAPIKRHITQEEVLRKSINKPLPQQDATIIVEEPAKPPVVKKPFVRKPFLTDRPFGNHVPLKELRDQLRAEQYRK